MFSAVLIYILKYWIHFSSFFIPKNLPFFAISIYYMYILVGQVILK